MTAVIAGVGMTAFGRHPCRTLRDLAEEAARAALADAGIGPDTIGAAVVGNAMATTMTGQEMVRGQAVLQGSGLHGLPIVNVENACASASTALHVAYAMIASGQHECVLALGVEKLYDADRARTMRALAGGTDVTTPTDRSFMDIYAERVREYMRNFGASTDDLAWIASKNRAHGVRNPFASMRTPVSPAEVLASPLVSDPLRRLMCCPITDGAAAAVVCSAAFARRIGARAIPIRASVLISGNPATDRSNEDVVARAAQRAYAMAGIAPADVDAIEVHDAAASGELLAYAGLGLCAPGEESRLVRDEATALGGKQPVNPSGGLQSRGNPSGATGLGQIAELVWQLRGDAGARQVPNARVALAENAGGMIGERTAAVCIHVLG
jgi:acetyl-CoA acyltransferase